MFKRVLGKITPSKYGSANSCSFTLYKRPRGFCGHVWSLSSFSVYNATWYNFMSAKLSFLVRFFRTPDACELPESLLFVGLKCNALIKKNSFWIYTSVFNLKFFTHIHNTFIWSNYYFSRNISIKEEKNYFGGWDAGLGSNSKIVSKLSFCWMIEFCSISGTIHL